MQVTAQHRETGQTVEGRLVTAALAVGKQKAMRLGLNPQELGIMHFHSFGWYELDKVQHVIKTKEAKE